MPPKFSLHPHLVNPHDQAHFFIPITLSFPKQKPISTYAFVDCGATNSHILDAFVDQHSLPWRAKSVLCLFLQLMIDHYP